MSRARLRASLVLAATVASLGSLAPARALSGATALVSVTSAGTQANAATPATSVPDTTSPALSLDGFTVAFSSDATNLTSGDTNHVADVFVHNLKTGKTTRVSTSSSGRQANGASYSPALNVYGTLIAFVSEATNLVSGDTNGVADVFVKNLSTGAVKRVSVSSGVAQANGASNSPFLSLFGDFLTFETAATNLEAGDTNGLPDAYLRDLKRNKTTRVVAPPLRQEVPTASGVQWTDSAQVSFDGRILTFVRAATRNVPRVLPAEPPVPIPSVDELGAPSTQEAGAPDTRNDLALSPALDPEAIRTHYVPSALDVYRLDRKLGEIERIQVQTSAYPVTGQGMKIMNDHPALSADGRMVAFESWRVLDRDDAVVRDPRDFKKILLFDSVAGVVMNESVSTFGVVGPNGDSFRPAVNAGGTIVAFMSEATNLVNGDDNGLTDVFVRDTPARSTSRSSVGWGGRQANGASTHPSISYEGRSVVFASTAANLTSKDRNTTPDVYWRDRQTNTADSAPILSPVTGVQSAIVGMEFTLQLRAKDADKDPITYGVLLNIPPSQQANPTGSALPHGARIDAATGEFTWTPEPQQIGPWYIAFWVTDPRGVVKFDPGHLERPSSLQLAKIEVKGPTEAL